MAKKTKSLGAKELSNRCNPRQFRFSSTTEITAKQHLVGQERAIEAIQYGLDMRLKGYNLYVMGPPGLGKHTLTKEMVIHKSRQYTAAQDWVYVYNFANPLKPKMIQLPPGMGQQFQHDMDNVIDQLHNEFSEEIAYNAIHALINKYREQKELVKHLNNCMKNITKSTNEFFNQASEAITLFDQPHIETLPFSRLKVNVLVDNANTIGSPVIFEDNPIYHNLIGRVENMHISGSLVSDFTLIRPGSLHRANNGYLILDAYEVLTHHLAWEGLKRALHTQQIHIEPLEQSIEFWSSQTLDPEPIPLDIKVIVIGDRDTYYMLCEDEPDFKELFKVVADFDNDLPRNRENQLHYAHLIATLAKQDQLNPLDKTAVASVIDYSSRLVEDQEKLSTNIHEIKSIIQQANYWSNAAHRNIILKEDIKKAIHKHNQRLSRIQLKTYEDILRGNTHIETEGEKVGQINALTILEVGDFEFGQPSKITATIHYGDGEIIDIQREVDQGGAIHSKGVFILSAFLKNRFAIKEKLTLSANLAFEQLYSSIDGDSASAAELCVLLSALADVPIKQALAMTGSINQFGYLQPISSCNEKIESFFHICQQRGLNGQQGVIIPADNKVNLMLNDELIDAVRKNQFHIYAVEHVDQAMELFTDEPMGEYNSKGEFKKGSINQKIEYCLQNYAKCLKARRQNRKI